MELPKNIFATLPELVSKCVPKDFGQKKQHRSGRSCPAWWNSNRKRFLTGTKPRMQNSIAPVASTPAYSRDYWTPALPTDTLRFNGPDETRRFFADTPASLDAAKVRARAPTVPAFRVTGV